MNVALQPLPSKHPRQRFTTDDVARMIDAGIMDEDERVELIDGELIDRGETDPRFGSAFGFSSTTVTTPPPPAAPRSPAGGSDPRSG